MLQENAGMLRKKHGRKIKSSFNYQEIKRCHGQDYLEQKRVLLFLPTANK